MMIIDHEGLIRRGGPLEALDELAGNRVIFVSAPAGYGKSVAVGQWAESRADVKAFMALDEYDDSVDGFCRRFCATVRCFQPQNSVLARQPRQTPRAQALAAVDSLTARRCGLLVIDDLHHLRNGAVIDLLGTLLGRLPHSIQAVLIGRDDWPLGLCGLHPGFIGPRQLRFSGGDVLSLHRKRGSAITPQAAEEIARHTGGWPVAVCALLRLAGEAERGGHLLMDDYIRLHVWSRWDEPTQAFMLNTALAETLDPQLCTHLAGAADSRGLLDGLARQGAFVSPVAEGAYAYHPILRDFLRRRLAEAGGQQERALLEREGRWHLSRKDFYSAVHCFIRGDSPAGIVDCFDLLERIDHVDFEAERMLPIIEAAPVQAAAGERPALLYYMAWAAYAQGRDRDMTRYLDAFYAHPPRGGAQGAIHSRRHRVTQLLDFRRPLIPQADGPAPAGLGGGRDVVTLGWPLLHRSIRDFSPMALGDIESLATQMAAHLAGADGARHVAACLAAGLLYEQGHYDRALDMLEDAGSADTAPLALCAGAVRVCALDALGRREEADTVLANTAALAGVGAEDPGLEALALRRGLVSGDVEAARRWLARYPGGPRAGTQLYGMYTAFTAARAFIAVGDSDSAIILLTRLHDLARRFERPLDQIEALILLATAYWEKQHGFQTEALGYLERAVCAAQPYGFTALFRGEQARLAAMLSRLRGRPGRSAESEAFLKALSHMLGQSASPVYGPPRPALRFTHKQRQVMGLLCQGMSQREIARRLDIKLPTLRSHMALIYKKLDVSCEGDAVRRMKALALTHEPDTQ